MTLADPTQPRWSLDSIEWPALRREAVTDNEAIFYLIAAASFIEATTDLYTQNLTELFADDPEITLHFEDAARSRVRLEDYRQPMVGARQGLD